MSLLQKIKDDQLTARKNRDSVRASLLTTLYSEASMVGKNNGNRETTDLEVIGITKKFLANVQELLALRPTDENAALEQSILLEILPKQMTDDELLAVLTTLHKEHSGNLGLVMKSMKEKHNGVYDGKKASEIFKSIKA